MAAQLNINVSVLSAIVLLFLFAQSTLGEIICENLCKDKCAFAVSSSGDRCILEKHVKRTGEEKYVCKTSDIQASGLKDWIETNECIEACGVERMSLGISSDSLLESGFTGKLCSPKCYNNCPNIVDLYFNLAAGEGVYLPAVCEKRGKNSRRDMSEMKSSGLVAPGPESSMKVVSFTDEFAPAEAPVYF